MSASDEIGNPTDNSRGFRSALGQFATGVTIITAQCDGQLAGMTANSFSSVSLDPPLILWSIGKSSQSLALFERAEHFAINVLAADQIDLASRFARSGPDKFEGVVWKAGIGGAPLFPGVSAAFECSKHAVIEAGDHFVWIGKVEQYTRANRDILLFAHGRFGLAVEFPAAGGDAVPGQAPISASNNQTTMLGLLWDAFSGMSHGFQAERDALGLSINQGRVLSLIDSHPGAHLDAITLKAFISPEATAEAVQLLITAGYIAVEPDGTWNATSKGHENATLRRQRATAFESDQLTNFSPAELAVTRKLLRALGSPRG
jgi:4-hydroxyphenylacetate 3-hydroxylase, reductase component